MPGPRSLWLLPPAAAGAVLRLWNLGSQILLDDELHGLRAALSWDLPKILTTYPVADICIPLAALYRGVAEAGVPLTEWTLRAPSVAAGIALTVILPLAFRPMAGERGHLVLAWLLALSPSLVFYSRINRPYALIALLAPLAVACFWRWWESGCRRWGGGYVLTGTLAGWLHLGALPFVVAPLGFAVLALGYRRLRQGPGSLPVHHGIRRLLTLGLLLALTVAVWLLPALGSLLRLFERKPHGQVPLERVPTALMLQAGSAVPAVAVLVGIAALGGLVVLWRRQPQAGLFTAVLVAAHWIAVAGVLRPFAIGSPIVLNRYLLVTLPVVLLWVARGLDELGSVGRGALGRVAGRAAVAGFLLVLAAGSPYRTDPRLRFGPFGGSTEAILFTPPPHRLPPEAVPSVYWMIAREPGAEAVLYTPAHPRTRPTLGVQALSRLHERDVLLGMADERLDDPRVALRTLVPAKPDALLASGARFVVLDREPGRLAYLARRSRNPRLRPAPPDAALVQAAAELETRLRESWGEPHTVEGPLRLWDLARVTPLPPRPRPSGPPATR